MAVKKAYRACQLSLLVLDVLLATMLVYDALAQSWYRVTFIDTSTETNFQCDFMKNQLFPIGSRKCEIENLPSSFSFGDCGEWEAFPAFDPFREQLCPQVGDTWGRAWLGRILILAHLVTGVWAATMVDCISQAKPTNLSWLRFTVGFGCGLISLVLGLFGRLAIFNSDFSEDFVGPIQIANTASPSGIYDQVVARTTNEGYLERGLVVMALFVVIYGVLGVVILGIDQNQCFPLTDQEKQNVIAKAFKKNKGLTSADNIIDSKKQKRIQKQALDSPEMEDIYVTDLTERFEDIPVGMVV